jgi:hypothetical protein
VIPGRSSSRSQRPRNKSSGEYFASRVGMIDRF